MVYVKILRYLGKNGGYAIEKVERWTVSIVNERTGMEKSLDGFMSGGYGMKQKYADNLASEWSELLQAPIRRFNTEYYNGNLQIEEQ